MKDTGPVRQTPLDIVVYNYLKYKKINVHGWELSYAHVSTELYWTKNDIEIFATPFWDGDDVMPLILSQGVKYNVLEEVDIYMWYDDITSNKTSVYKFIEWYLNLMAAKLKCLDLNYV